MAEIIRMPKMSDTMVEGVIATWLKKVGDPVKVGEIIAEIETDKATMALEAYESGTLLHIGVPEQQAAPVNEVIAIIGQANEDISALLSQIQQETTTAHIMTQAASPSSPTSPTISAIPVTSTVPTAPQPTPTSDHRIAASPLAKKMAQLQGYDLPAITGTGEGGRIIKRDIENVILTKKSSHVMIPPLITAPQGYQESYEQIPISPMRKTIARRLTESTLTVPHFYLTVTINMHKLVVARARMNEYSSVKITFNDIVIKAVALAIRQHPAVNTAWLEDAIRYNNHIHIGVAMAIEAGLVVPVIKFADHKSLAQIATEVKQLTQKAQSNQLQPADLEGSTFTTSNLGMLGIESFTAIINQPAACILAVGAIQQVPIVQEGVVVPGHVMKVTLSCDHRVVDGAIGAALLQTLQELLEEPLKLLV